jgi:hypothetical protein
MNEAGLASIILPSFTYSLIHAIFLRAACQAVLKFRPNFGNAYLAALAGNLAGGLLGLVFGQQLMGDSAGPESFIFLLVAAVVVSSFVYGELIKTPQGEKIGFENGIKVTLLAFLISIVMIAIFFGVVILIVRNV